MRKCPSDMRHALILIQSKLILRDVLEEFGSYAI